MKVVESTQGRLVLRHRGFLAEAAVILFMALMGGLAWLVYPVDYVLSLILLACVLMAGVVFLLLSVSTTVIFDRIHNLVLIRRTSAFRAREREVPLAEVARVTLLPTGLGNVDHSGIIALDMRAGSPRGQVPLTPEPLPRREGQAALGAINDWLGVA